MVDSIDFAGGFNQFNGYLENQARRHQQEIQLQELQRQIQMRPEIAHSLGFLMGGNSGPSLPPPPPAQPTVLPGQSSMPQQAPQNQPWQPMPSQAGPPQGALLPPPPQGTQGGSQGGPPGMSQGPQAPQSGMPPGMPPVGMQQQQLTLGKMWDQLKHNNVPDEVAIATIQQYKDLLPPQDQAAMQMFTAGLNFAAKQAAESGRNTRAANVQEGADTRANNANETRLKAAGIAADRAAAGRSHSDEQMNARFDHSDEAARLAEEHRIEADARHAAIQSHAAQNKEFAKKVTKFQDKSVAAQALVANLKEIRRTITGKRSDDEPDNPDFKAHPEYVGAFGRYGAQAAEFGKEVTGTGDPKDYGGYQNFKSRVIEAQRAAPRVMNYGGTRLAKDAAKDDDMVRAIGSLTTKEGARKSLDSLIESIESRYAQYENELSKEAEQNQQGSEPSMPKKGDVVGDYIFMGGDPSDKDNWAPK